MPTIDQCRGCPYRAPAIGPRGNPASRIVLVGEAPGATEVADGRPFIGRAGEKLWEALAEARLSETDVFITNSVACRPLNPIRPKVRTPSPEAIRACHGRLARDIELHPRAVIVALGVTAVQALTGRRGFPVTKKARRTELPSDWGTVVPTLHPAFVLRRPEDYPILVADLKHARRLAEETGSAGVAKRVPSVPEFRLRFPISKVRFWAKRYSYTDDSEVEAIGESAGKRGWYTRDEFLSVSLWKTDRSKSRCAKNSASTVEEVTEVALRASDERLRIGALTVLQGVEMPTASVLLHLALQTYPIIDYRALWSLGIDPPPAYYSFEFWWKYTRACRALADEAGVSMRTLDRALWQYSKEHQSIA